jgi:hypothetical protein
MTCRFVLPATARLSALWTTNGAAAPPRTCTLDPRLSGRRWTRTGSLRSEQLPSLLTSTWSGTAEFLTLTLQPSLRRSGACGWSTRTGCCGCANGSAAAPYPSRGWSRPRVAPNPRLFSLPPDTLPALPATILRRRVALMHVHARPLPLWRLAPTSRRALPVAQQRHDDSGWRCLGGRGLSAGELIPCRPPRDASVGLGGSGHRNLALHNRTAYLIPVTQSHSMFNSNI